MALAPADAEQAIIDELDGTWNTSTGLQTNSPAFMRVVSAGGYQLNEVTDEFLLTLESFASTETAARDNLAAAVAELYREAEAGTLGNEVCYGIRTATTVQNYPMPTVPTHKRYLVTLAVRLRRREV